MIASLIGNPLIPFSAVANSLGKMDKAGYVVLDFRPLGLRGSRFGQGFMTSGVQDTRGS